MSKYHMASVGAYANVQPDAKPQFNCLDMFPIYCKRLQSTDWGYNKSIFKMYDIHYPLICLCVISSVVFPKTSNRCVCGCACVWCIHDTQTNSFTSAGINAGMHQALFAVYVA